MCGGLDFDTEVDINAPRYRFSYFNKRNAEYKPLTFSIPREGDCCGLYNHSFIF